MKRRCYSPSSPRYATYGGRGIQVCDRWRDDFSAFLEDMGFRPTTKHSLGRIDNDGDYGPDNCRWELPEQQANNTTRNTHITIADQTKSVAQWARKHGVDPNLAQARIHNLGWSVEDACTLPAQRPGPKPRPKPPCAVCGVPCKTVQAHTCSKKCAWTLRRRRS